MCLKRILKAVDAQANDPSLWFIPKYVSEDILQKALRDLHRVIEEDDSNALRRIIEQAKDV